VFSFTTTALFDSEYSEGGFVAIFMCILFAHENLAFRVGDLLRKARRKTLAAAILQQGFPTQLSATKERA
jgi:hypothetical protein